MMCTDYDLGLLETTIGETPRGALHEWHKCNVRINWI